MIEHRFSKPRVTGLNPVTRSMHGCGAESLQTFKSGKTEPVLQFEIFTIGKDCIKEHLLAKEKVASPSLVFRSLGERGITTEKTLRRTRSTPLQKMK